jgi:hypothetical protein
VKGRLFAQLDDHHHGADHLAVWLPAPLGEQEAMIFTDPARFFRPPYVGHKGWVGVRIDGRPDWTAVASLAEQAYRLVASRGPGQRGACAGDPTRTEVQAARRPVGGGGGPVEGILRPSGRRRLNPRRAHPGR